MSSEFSGATASGEQKLVVFVISTMDELADLRDVLREKFSERGLEPIVYESTEGANETSVHSSSMALVKRADAIIALFDRKLGSVTQDEFRLARSLGLPCFAYIRERKTRSPELDEFLAADVTHIHDGVSPKYFHNATSLASQAADDISRWFVQRYRELSAVQAQEVRADEESRQREVDLDRIRMSSTAQMPTGTEVDLLASRLRQWFDAIGFTTNERRRTDDYFEWLVTIPVRGAQYQRVLVRGVRGEGKSPAVNALAESVRACGADEGWLVSNLRMSSAARSTAAAHIDPAIVCLTLDEVIDQDADFEPYFKWLEDEVRRLEIDRHYVDLACSVDEVDPVSGSIVESSQYGENEGWVDGYIDRWLDDRTAEHISVLGEFGAGKTWFALHYASQQLALYRLAKQNGTERPRIPLIIPLRGAANIGGIEAVFSEFFFRRHKISIANYEAFEYLNRLGRFLLIFDGFDEMSMKVDRQSMVDNFWNLAAAVVPGAKAIVTSRTEYFPSGEEVRELFGARIQTARPGKGGDPPRFDVVRLDPMTEPQIRAVLELRAPAATVDRILDETSLKDLASRPVMASLIVDALPHLHDVQSIDLARIYLYAVRAKLERDIASERTFTSLPDKFYFLCELAWEMFHGDNAALNYRDFPNQVRRCFGTAVRTERDLDHWQHDMMGQTLLIRKSGGDYEFAHKSFVEFFVAFKLTAELGVLKSDFVEVVATEPPDPDGEPTTLTWSAYFEDLAGDDIGKRRRPPLARFEAEPPPYLVTTFGARSLPDVVRSMLEQMLEESPRATDAIGKLILTTAEPDLDDPDYLGGNAANLLLSSDPAALAGKNMPRVRLRGARFRGCDLRDIDLRGAELAQCGFAQADLRHANLQGATFTDVTGLPDSRGSGMRLGTTADSVAAAIERVGFAVWRSDDVEIPTDVIPSEDPPRLGGPVAFSPDGKYVAWSGLGGTARIMNLTTRDEIEIAPKQRLRSVRALTWADDSRALYVTHGRSLWSRALATTKPDRVISYRAGTWAQLSSFRSDGPIWAEGEKLVLLKSENTTAPLGSWLAPSLAALLSGPVIGSAIMGLRRLSSSLDPIVSGHWSVMLDDRISLTNLRSGEVISFETPTVATDLLRSDIAFWTIKTSQDSRWAAVKPDGTKIAIGGKGIAVIDVDSGDTRHFLDNGAAVKDVVASPDGIHFHAASDDALIRTWTFDDPVPRQTRVVDRDYEGLDLRNAVGLSNGRLEALRHRGATI